MRTNPYGALAVLGLAVVSGPALAQKGMAPTAIIVGGAPMISDRDIIENLSRSAKHQVFIGLLQTAGLTDMLRQHGPFTVFAPTDAAFAALPAGKLDTLRQPEHKDALIKLLQTHIIPGDYSTARLHFLMRTNKNQAVLDDSADGKLTVISNGPSNLALRDGKGAMADITLYDVRQANGMVYIIDRVLAPN